MLSGLACGLTVLLVTAATASDIPAQVRDRLKRFAIVGAAYRFAVRVSADIG